jgi:hypothetical protein
MPSQDQPVALVRVKGQQLLLGYNVEDDGVVEGTPEVSCWIPSTAGSLRPFIWIFICSLLTY